MRIFLDNSATTPIDPEVLESMTSVMAGTYGNPSSIHAEGRKARALIEAARKTVADCLNCSISVRYFSPPAVRKPTIWRSKMPCGIWE